MKYFAHCTTLDEVKKTYRAKAFELHPDKGGSLEAMQELNKEYSFICAKLAKGQNVTAEETEATILGAEKYREALEKIIHLDGLIIELVGSWIWVSGPGTYEHRSEKTGGTGLLGKAGFMWASAKKMWFFRSEEYKVRNYGESFSIDQIKNKYGSQTLSSGNYKRMIA